MLQTIASAMVILTALFRIPTSSMEET